MDAKDKSQELQDEQNQLVEKERLAQEQAIFVKEQIDNDGNFMYDSSTSK